MKQKVFVVDDNPAYLRAINRYLAADGWSVETFDKPHRMFDALGGELPFAIISDIEMPDMSGPALMKLVMDAYPAMRGRVTFCSSSDQPSLLAYARVYGNIIEKSDSKAISAFLRGLLEANVP